MSEFATLFALFGVMLILVALARRVNIPSPVLLVVGGLAMSFIPGLPHIELKPELVFFIFLPPILQQAAYFTSNRDFVANLRSIGLLAIGLVIATTTVVAVVAHYVVGMEWATAFVLGAIVAPPDAVAATSIAEKLHLPRRIVTILEGESLINDATALVAYRLAVATVVGGSFSLVNAGIEFVVASVGGIMVGLVVGYISARLFPLLVNDPPVYIVFTFLVGYLAYLAAEVIHVSGVLAVVVLGIFISIPRYNSMTAELRSQAFPIWQIVVFFINCFIFLQIGLQLPLVFKELRSESWITLLGYAAAICATVIIFRIMWVYPGTYLPRLIPSIREKDGWPKWENVFIVAWTGMRGVVSLAAALSLPLTTGNGTPFPDRDLILYLTFCVILSTLVMQGLSLTSIVKWLKVADDGEGEREENKARLKAAYAGRNRLRELEDDEGVTPEMVTALTKRYEKRIALFTARHKQEVTDHEQQSQNFVHVERLLLQAELQTILDLRNEGTISDEVWRKVEHDIDLELLRLNTR